MRYPSGISSTLPDADGDDTPVWLARVRLEMGMTPIGESAPCMNPECAGPVDFIRGSQGEARLYCSRRCSNRASQLRLRARQQLDVIDRLLEATKGKQGIPRDELAARARQLRWWLARLGTGD